MRTVSSPSPSLPKLTIEGPSPYSSPTLPLPLRPLRPTLMPSHPSSTSLSRWETLPGCPFASPPTRPNSPSTLSPSPSSRRIRASSSRASRNRSLSPRTFASSPPDSSTQTPAQERAKLPRRSLSPFTLGTSRQWVPPSDSSLTRVPLSGPTPQTDTLSARIAGASATSLPDARLPTQFAPFVSSTTPVRPTAVPTPPALEVATLRLLLAVALPHRPAASTVATITPPYIGSAKAVRYRPLSGVQPLPPRTLHRRPLATRWTRPPTTRTTRPPLHPPAPCSRRSRWLLQGPEGRRYFRPQYGPHKAQAPSPRGAA